VLENPDYHKGVEYIIEKFDALPEEKQMEIMNVHERLGAALKQMEALSSNPDPRSQNLMAGQEVIVRSAVNALNSAIDSRLPRGGGKRRRRKHKTPRRPKKRQGRRARKSTFRRRRKH
jgi:hypothetical protein